jgi:iron complex transport system ATP-binding protein
MSRLVANDLHVRLGDRKVLDGVSLDLRPGELVGLLGPNASGKTTLLRSLANLIEPVRGEVLLDDEPIAGLTPRKRARRLAYLEQGASSEWPLPVARLVALGRAPHLGAWGRPTTEDEAVVTNVMERCDVVHLAERSSTALSGGERARVMLARALATSAPVLLADEPVSHLDPYHQLRIMAVIRNHADEGGSAIAALHDLTLATRFCDRIILLLDGKIAAEGPPAEILTAECLARVFSINATLVDQNGALHVVQHGPIERTDPDREDDAS